MRITNVKLDVDSDEWVQAVSKTLEVCDKHFHRKRIVRVIESSATVAASITVAMYYSSIEKGILTAALCALVFIFINEVASVFSEVTVTGSGGRAASISLHGLRPEMVDELRSIEDVNETSDWFCRFIHTSIGEQCIHLSDIIAVILDKTPCVIEVDLGNESGFIRCDSSIIDFELSDCYFSSNEYKGDGSDLVLYVGEDSICLVEDSLELKPVNIC